MFCSTEFPSPVTPTRTTFNYALLHQLAASHTVEALAPIAWTEELRWRLRHHQELTRCYSTDGIQVVHPRYYYTPGILRHRYHAYLHSAVHAGLRMRAHDTVPDVILSYWAHPDGAVAARLAQEWRVPSILMVGGSDVLVFTRTMKRRRAIVRALSSADAVVAVGNQLRDRIVELGVQPDRVRVIKRGVDATTFHRKDKAVCRLALGIPPNASVLLWAGRMVGIKGLSVLLSALPAVISKRPETVLCLIGTGPEEPALRKQAKKLGLQEHVRFCGPRPHQELPTWFNAADATVLPSLSEGIPNVLLESLACGTPFVATSVGGIPEIDHQGGGVLIDPRNSQQLGDALIEVLNGPLAVPPSYVPRQTEEFAAGILALAEELCGQNQERRYVPSIGSTASRLEGSVAGVC